jgi:hypothetical protein
MMVVAPAALAKIRPVMETPPVPVKCQLLFTNMARLLIP